MLVDGLGRQITHLRLSLTDQCNFRCVYCMPPDGLETAQTVSYLQVSEIVRLAKIFSELGITKIRLTGGEPLVRKEVIQIVAALRTQTNIQNIAITTNGSLLLPRLKPLKDAGLNRLNISLDSLCPQNFKKIALKSDYSAVMDSIEQAVFEGYRPKINMVVMKGLNDHEIPDFINFSFQNGIEEVRFIEFMPLCGTGWKPQHVFDLTETIEGLQDHYQVSRVLSEPSSVSESYVIQKNGKKGKVGFIRTLSKPFCGSCSRIRVSATGDLKPCLFSHDFVALKPYLETGSDEEIQNLIRQAVLKKSKGNEFSNQYNQKVRLKNTLYDGASTPSRVNYPSIRAIGG